MGVTTSQVCLSQNWPQPGRPPLPVKVVAVSGWLWVDRPEDGQELCRDKACSTYNCFLLTSNHDLHEPEGCSGRTYYILEYPIYTLNHLKPHLFSTSGSPVLTPVHLPRLHPVRRLTSRFRKNVDLENKPNTKTDDEVDVHPNDCDSGLLAYLRFEDGTGPGGCRGRIPPNLRFGTTGPSWHLHDSASNHLRRWQWIPIGVHSSEPIHGSGSAHSPGGLLEPGPPFCGTERRAR